MDIPVLQMSKILTTECNEIGSIIMEGDKIACSDDDRDGVKVIFVV
jgi:hypothetical protein